MFKPCQPRCAPRLLSWLSSRLSSSGRAAQRDVGISQDKSGLGTSVIAAFVGRNAGTGLNKWPSPGRDRMNDAVVQRLLEMIPERGGRSAGVLVNEAVAYASGYTCPSYKQLPVAMKGCTHQVPPVQPWRDTGEVALNAAALGFVCDPPQSGALTCTYHGSRRASTACGSCCCPPSTASRTARTTISKRPPP